VLRRGNRQQHAAAVSDNKSKNKFASFDDKISSSDFKSYDNDDNLSDISSLGDNVVAAAVSSPKHKNTFASDDDSAQQAQSISQHMQQHNASGVDDLYGYIGVPPREAKQYVDDGSQLQEKYNVGNGSSDANTAEERLKKLVAGLGNGSASSKLPRSNSTRERERNHQNQQPKRTNGAVNAHDDNDSEISFEGANGRLSSAASIGSISNASSSGQSLYDLANLNIRPSSSSSSNRRPINSTIGKAPRAAADPLQAFEQMQKSGVVRARYDVGTEGNNLRATTSVPSSRRSAWGDDGKVSSSVDFNSAGSGGLGGGVKVSPRFASPQLRAAGPSGEPQQQKVYR